MPRLVVRSVQATDLNVVLEIARETGPGFNSLPNNFNTIESKITHSLESFSEKNEPHQRLYFFVMAEDETQAIAGTAGIEASVGHTWPYYKFHVSTLAQVSKRLKTTHEHLILHVSSDYNNATELGALYLRPEYRGHGYGGFLSRARCLFIAAFPHLFSPTIIADMRGISVDGISPFWEEVGFRFFGINYEEASYLKATEGSQLLADLLAHYPLYADFFSKDARNAIGKTHVWAVPALQVLTKEGFTFNQYIDVFDGGPIIEVLREDLKTVRLSKRTRVKAFKKKIDSGKKVIIANTKLDFRATLSTLEITSTGEVVLEDSLGEILNIGIGEEIVYCSL